LPGSLTSPAIGAITIMQPWDGNSELLGASGYRCMDQIGAGVGALIANFDPTPVGPIGNALEPIYAWGNTLNGLPSPVVSNVPTYILVGRDLVNTAKPGY